MTENNSAQIILDCIKELAATVGAAKKAAILERSGLSPHVVKEKLDKMLEDGIIKRLERGVYLPVKAFPAARPISRTLLSDGMAVVEVGEVVLHLTPQEELQLSKMYAGSAVVHTTTVPVAAAQAPQPQRPHRSLGLFNIDDIAELFMVSRRYAVDTLTKKPDFPARLRGTSRHRALWAESSIRAYWSQESRTTV